MKILQITPYFYPSPRGTELYTYKLSENLLKLGHAVDILTINSENVDKEEVLWGKSRVYRCSLDFRYSRGEFSYEFVKGILKATDYDLYHVQIPFASGLEATIVAAGRNHIPLVATHHGQSFEGTLLYRMIVKSYDAFFTSLGIRFIDRIIFFARSYSDSLRVSPGIRKKFRVIRPAIDVERFSPSAETAELRRRLGFTPEEKIVLFVGGLSSWDRRKGAHYLIAAMAEVEKKIPAARLVIVGGGELVPELKRLANHLGLESQVFFAGPVYGEELSRYYAMCDLFVLPSIHEPFGLVILEAMASGKAVIASDIPGARDNVRHGETGLKVPPAAPPALGEAISYLLGDDELRNRMGQNARKEAEGRSWEEVAQETVKAYHEVLK